MDGGSDVSRLRGRGGLKLSVCVHVCSLVSAAR